MKLFVEIGPGSHPLVNRDDIYSKHCKWILIERTRLDAENTTQRLDFSRKDTVQEVLTDGLLEGLASLSPDSVDQIFMANVIGLWENNTISPPIRNYEVPIEVLVSSCRRVLRVGGIVTIIENYTPARYNPLHYAFITGGFELCSSDDVFACSTTRKHPHGFTVQFAKKDDMSTEGF